ncbi:MAG: hypothetical protein KJ882_05015 [Proteobacteria bacterium]|nr:hypothetical protein [Pseudomonadota bacterium]
MAQFFLGVKIVEAWPEMQGDIPGYGVKYEDDHVSWRPKEAFERAFFPMGEDPSKVNPVMVDSFLGTAEARNLEDGKTTLVKSKMLTGFTQYETASCVDPANYDEVVGREIALNRIKNTIWKCLGFVVQWGRFGLKQ